MTTTLKLGSCPRCKEGSTELKTDHYGSYLNCLQCGYTVDVVSSSSSPRPLFLRGNWYVFRYTGDAQLFAGIGLQARLLSNPTGGREKYAVGCPFAECALPMKPGSQGTRIHAATGRVPSGWHVYFCAQRHCLYLNIRRMEWV